MSIDQWSSTPANNASGVTGVNWAEGQAPSTVNDSARQLMADVATWYAAVDPAGRIEQYGGSSAPTGWLECDGSAVDRTTYARLFTAISTTWGIGNGTTTFNVPDFRGRVLVGKGTGTTVASGTNADVDTAADTLTVASNNTTWITGMAVVFTLASGTITGLTSGNTYYIVRNSTTLVKLASSLANAQNGTVVDMTAKSSPVWTITYTLTARSLAEKGGEESHAMSSTELLSHPHTLSTLKATGGSLGNYKDPTDSNSSASLEVTQSTGGNVAMNTMQCYGVTMFIIRT
jgi:microcystin-dependent protein